MFDDEATQGSGTQSAQRSIREANLELDAVFEVLANRLRRFGLYSLCQAPDQVIEFRLLLDDVVTLDAAVRDTPFSRHRYLEIGTDLYEWHLPVLADVGVIEFDARHETIRYLGDATLNFWLQEVRCYELPE